MLRKVDRDAQFTVFMAEGQASLLRTAWLLTGDRDAARDLVQSALVKTYAAWSRLDRSTALAYARKCVVTQRIDAWRRTKHEDLTADVAAGPEAWSRESADCAMELVVDSRDEIIRMLQQLPPQQRTIVVLRYYHDLSERAVAETLGISEGAVKSQASRGLAALRRSTPDTASVKEGSR